MVLKFFLFFFLFFLLLILIKIALPRVVLINKINEIIELYTIFKIILKTKFSDQNEEKRYGNIVLEFTNTYEANLAYESLINGVLEEYKKIFAGRRIKIFEAKKIKLEKIKAEVILLREEIKEH